MFALLCFSFELFDLFCILRSMSAGDVHKVHTIVKYGVACDGVNEFWQVNAYIVNFYRLFF